MRMIKGLLSLVYLFLSVAAFAQITQAKKADDAWKYGFADKNDRWIVKPIYDTTRWNEEGQYGVFSTNGSKEGAVNSEGKIIVPEEYDMVYKAKEGYMRVENGKGDDERVGAYSLDGKLILPCKYRQILAYEYYLCVENESHLHGAYDYQGNVVLEEKYSFPVPISSIDSGWTDNYRVLNIGGTKNSVTGEIKGGQFGMYSNIDGSIIVPCEYEGAVSAREGLIAVKKNGKWALFGNGSLLTPFQYDNNPSFNNGVATVKQNGEVKLIKNPLRGSDLNLAQTEINDKKERKKAVSRYPAPSSDVDENIPVARRSKDNLFAFVIANENYEDAPVPYALNDGRMFGNYCTTALGVPEKNLFLYEDATMGEILAAIAKMKSVAKAYEGDASVIFYYAGHGFPDEKNNSAYLLPIDGDARQIEQTGISLATLYADIAQLPFKNSFVLLDACFSGAKREDVMLSSSRGVAIKVKNDVPPGNLVVFSASQGDETAHQLEEKGHGLFTYYLLKELQQTGGDVNLGDLSDYVTKQVKRQSVVVNDKKQTPTVIPSLDRFETWREIRF